MQEIPEGSSGGGSGGAERNERDRLGGMRGGGLTNGLHGEDEGIGGALSAGVVDLVHEAGAGDLVEAEHAETGVVGARGFEVTRGSGMGDGGGGVGEVAPDQTGLGFEIFHESVPTDEGNVSETERDKSKWRAKGRGSGRVRYNVLQTKGIRKGSNKWQEGATG